MGADLVRTPHGDGDRVATVGRHALIEQACGLALEWAEVEVVRREELIFCTCAVQLTWVRAVAGAVPERGGDG